MKRSNTRKVQQRLLRAIDDHHALVYRVAYRVLGSREDAEDITQEVYLACIERPEMLGSVRNLRSYLVRAALNRAHTLARRRKNCQKREEVWAMEYASRRRDDGLSTQETGVREAIAALPEKLRMPLVLYYEEGLKHREIAAVLGCPRGTVADRLAMGRERLRERLAQAGVALPGKELERLLRARQSPEIPLSPTLARRIRDEIARRVAALPAAPAAASASLFSGTGVAIALGLGLSFAGGLAILLGSGLFGESSRAACGKVHLQEDRRGPAALESAAAALRWRRDLLRNGRSRPVSEPARVSPEDAEGEGAVIPARGFFGRIEDESGGPLEGATVRYLGPHGTVRAETKSREDGSYTLEVPIEEPAAAEAMYSAMEYDADHRLALESRSYHFHTDSSWLSLKGSAETPCSRCHEDGEGVTRRLDLSYVLDRKTYEENALRDAEATSTDVRRVTDLWGVWGYAGEAGGYRYQYGLAREMLGGVLDVSGSERSTLEAFSDGCIAATGDADSLSEDQPTREVDFVLYPASDLRGRVFDSAGDGIPSARVRVAGWLSDEEFPSAVLKVDTEPDGAFRFTSLPRGAYLIQVVAPRHVTLEALVHTGVPARLDLEPAARITVRAEDEEGEVRGVCARLLDRGQRALERAAEDDLPPTFEKVPAGEYVLQVFRPGAELASFEETLVLEGSEDMELTVYLPLPSTVTGRVLDPSGAAVPVGEVRFHPLDRTRLRDDGCASDRPKGGKPYAVGDLAPGRYLVTVTEREDHGLPLLHREVVIRPGERVARRDLILDRERGSLELSLPEVAKLPPGIHLFPPPYTTRVYREDSGETVLSAKLPGGIHTLALPAGVYAVEVERAGHEPRRVASLWVPPQSTRRVDVALLRRTRPLPRSAASGKVRLRRACRLGSVLELLEEDLPGNVTWSRAVERSGILENAWLESFSGPVSELAERIERIGPRPLSVHAAGKGLFIDYSR